MKKRSSKRGPVRAKKVVCDGIQFASGLEKYMYLALKKAKIKSVLTHLLLNVKAERTKVSLCAGKCLKNT